MVYPHDMFIKTDQTVHLTWVHSIICELHLIRKEYWGKYNWKDRRQHLLLWRGRRMENTVLGREFLLSILYTVRILYQVHILLLKNWIFKRKKLLRERNK